MNRFMLRLLTAASPGKALQILVSTALADWPRDFEKARRAHENRGDPVLGHFFETMEPIVAGLPADGALPKKTRNDIIALWATHCLPKGVYGLFRSLVGRDQDVSLMMSMFKAEDGIADLRPNLVDDADATARPTKSKAALESVDTRQAREDWKETSLFRMWGPEMTSAAEGMRDLCADDLHAIACALEGIDQSPIILALAAHPKLDRGTALEILYGFSAAAYQRRWRAGASEEEFFDTERQLFPAFETIASRAEGGRFRSARFANRFQGEMRRNEARAGAPLDDSDPDLPWNWAKWRLPQTALAPTENEKPQPQIDIGADGFVRWAFDTWQRKARR